MIKGSYVIGNIFHHPLNSIEDGAGAVMKIYKMENLYAIERFTHNLMLITRSLHGQLWLQIYTLQVTYIAVIRHVNDSLGIASSKWFTINKVESNTYY